MGPLCRLISGAGLSRLINSFLCFFEYSNCCVYLIQCDYESRKDKQEVMENGCVRDA